MIEVKVDSTVILPSIASQSSVALSGDIGCRGNRYVGYTISLILPIDTA